MAIKDFEFTLIKGERLVKKEEKPHSLRIDHNTTITLISFIDEDTVEMRFRYTVTYGHVGNIQMEGRVEYEGNASEIISLWDKEHRMSNEIAEDIHNTILSNGSFEALILARKLNLPPPIKLNIPRVKFSEKGKKADTDYSPEIA